MTGFVKAPARLVDDRRLSLSARAVYCTLARLVWEAGKQLNEEVELPTVDVIAQRCGVSTNALRGYVKELRIMEWVVVHRASRRRPQRYVIKNEPGSADSSLLAAASRAGQAPLLAGARVIGSGSVVGEGFEVQDNYRGEEANEPPPVVLVEGRNLALDALCEVGGVDPASPRLVQAVVALNGRLHKTTGKLLEPGIRHLFWIECVRWAEAHDAVDRLELAYEDPAEWSRALARRIEEKGERYSAVYSGAARTPKALRDHWLDLDRVRRPGAGLSADEMERME